MSTIFAAAEKEFLTAVSEVRNLLDFIRIANSFRPLAQNIYNYNDEQNLHEQSKQLYKQFVAQKDVNPEVAFNGMMISLASSFEAFFRRLIRDGFIEITKRVKTYLKLSDSLRRKHLISSGFALVSIQEPIVEADYDFDLICRNLGNCHKATTTLTLNTNVFHTKISSLTPSGIDEGLGRIDIKIDWEAFGRDRNLREALKVTGVREATKEACKWLREFVGVRNRIAHTGIIGYLTKQSQIEDAVGFFDAFAPVLANSVEEAITSTVKA